MSVELITALGTGLTSVLGALAVLLANRSRRVTEDSRLIRRQARDLQKKLVAALGHIFALETELASRGITVPPRPDALEKDEDDDGGTTQPANARATS